MRIAALDAGVCVPGASCLEDFWAGAVARRAPSSVEQFDLLDEPLPVFRVGDIPYLEQIEPHVARRLDRTHALAFSALPEGVAKAFAEVEPERRGVVIGTGYGAGPFSQTQNTRLREKGVRSVSPLVIPITMPASVASHLGIALDARGPVQTVSTACAAGADAIAWAARLLRLGECDIVLAGGVESLLYDTVLAGFLRAGALAGADLTPPSRPFDASRAGFVMGEGAALVLLCREEDVPPAERPLAMLRSAAATNDAAHMAAPDPEGAGIIDAVRHTLRNADVDVRDVGFVNAHGTSTRQNDDAEGAALASVFGADNIPVTALKGNTGHMVGASGAAEFVASCLSCQTGLVPPTAGTEEVDPKIPVDLVVGEARPIEARVGISISAAFGGSNTVLLVGNG